MTESKDSREPVTIMLDGYKYVLEPKSQIRVGGEYKDIYMESYALESTLLEVARTPPDVTEQYAFWWPQPQKGDISVVEEFDETVVLAGSTRVGYTSDWDAHPLDPLPDTYQRGPWLSSRTQFASEYAPLRIRNLHERFAHASRSTQSLTRFAHRYGFLGHNAFTLGLWEKKPVVTALIESLHHWAREAATMQRLLDIWQHVRQKDAGWLSRWVRWHAPTTDRGDFRIVEWREPYSQLDRYDDPTKILPYLDSTDIASDIGKSLPIPSDWREGDVIKPAFQYLCHRISERLDGHVKPYLLSSRAGDIHLWPDCLVSAMYVLLAFEVSGRKLPARICKECGELFDPNRSSHVYCSDRCRGTAWARDDKDEDQTDQEQQ